MRPRTVFALTIAAIAVASPALAGFAGTDLFIPMAGRGAGAYPSNWFTTVYLYNPNPTAVSVDLTFLERNKDNVATSPPKVTDTLAPGETKVYDNIVEVTFGQTGTVYGAIRIQCASKVVASTRVLSKESADAPLTQSFGQDFAATPASFAIGLHETTDILGGYSTLPYQDSAARFNIGCVETTGLGSATVRWVARDGSGQQQKSYDRVVPRLSQTQGFFHQYFDGIDLTNSRISATVIAGVGKVLCYGSLVTNDQEQPKPVQDPTTFEMSYPARVLAENAQGAISGVTAGGGLTGGGTSGEVTLNVGAGEGIGVAADTVSIADRGVTKAKLSATGDTPGQVLGTDGTGLTWQDDGLTLPFSGTGTSDSPLLNIVNLGTSGAISTLSLGNYGVWGESASASGIGVYGANKRTSGPTYGVFGDVYSPSGFSGYFQGGKFYVQGDTGIGTSNPTAKLDVNGQVKITGGAPGAGKVLTSDAAGLASWQAAAPGPWQQSASDVYYSSGNVGIGLSNPSGMLEIYGDSVDTYPTLLLSEAGGYSRVSFRTMAAASKHWVLAGHTNPSDAASQFNLNYNNGSTGTNVLSVFGDSRIELANRMVIGADGDIEMAKTLNLNTASGWGAALKVAGAQALWWDGTYFSWGYGGNYNYFADPVTIGNPATPGYMLYVQGTAYATGSWSSSDARFKRNVVPIDHALDRIMRVEGASFEFRSEEFPDYRFDTGTQLGLVAQDLEEVFPEVVKTEADGFKSVNYNGMIPVLLEAVKEQQREIEELRALVAALQRAEAVTDRR